MSSKKTILYVFDIIHRSDSRGNGRSTRICLDLILNREMHEVIDWGLVDKNDYLLALKGSLIKDVEIKEF